MSGKAKQARTTIAVQGARVHNLKNVSIELPRDRLIVVTGLSGSGKSSLAFDTIYAEGQRRYMESLSSYAKRFVAQVAKPDVDFVFGLSPVISIEQKTIGSNPRSTVGTMTDIASYLNLLFATVAEARCPRTGERVAMRSANQILEGILGLPEGTEIELRAPVFPVYGEELEFVFTEVRKKGCRELVIDGKRVDLGNEVEIDETKVRDMDAVVDRFVVAAKHEKAIKAGVAATLLVGDGLMQIQVLKGPALKSLTSATHHFVYGGIEPEYFMFNNPESACRTCGGLGADSRSCSRRERRGRHAGRGARRARRRRGPPALRSGLVHALRGRRGGQRRDGAGAARALGRRSSGAWATTGWAAWCATSCAARASTCAG